MSLPRREFLLGAAAFAVPAPRFLYMARGAAGLFGGGSRLAMMDTAGHGHILDFHRPNETGWGVYDCFADGRRVLLMSIEMNADWKTKPFQEFYARSRTHIWVCDLDTERLTEAATRDRLAPFYAPCALLLDEQQLLAGVNRDGRERLYRMNLDGSDAQPVTSPDEFVYGVSVNPAGTHLAFHADYRIYTARLDGTARVEVGGNRGDIYFGTSWSPDGGWVLFQVCHAKTDPGHDWSDIWIGRADGSRARPLTEGQSAWFATSFGTKENPGNGSNMPRWAPDGSGILYSRRSEGARSPWEFQTTRPDTTHFNRDFHPQQARGGTHICMVDPHTGRSTPLTEPEPGKWEFRATWSPDSRQILFCRARTGENPALWLMDRHGRHQRQLTTGADGQGADFPRWLPRRKS